MQLNVAKLFQEETKAWLISKGRLILELDIKSLEYCVLITTFLTHPEDIPAELVKKDDMC